MRKKLMLFFLTVVLVPVVVIYVVAMSIFSAEAEKNLMAQQQNNIDAITKVVETDFSEAVNISIYPLIDATITRFLLAEPESVGLGMLQDVYDTLLAMPISTSGIVMNIAICRSDGTTVFSGASSSMRLFPFSESDAISEAEKRLAAEAQGNTYYSYSPGRQNSNITLLRQLKNISNFDQDTGTMKLVFSTSHILNKLKSDRSVSGAEYLLVDEAGALVLGTCTDNHEADFLSELISPYLPGNGDATKTVKSDDGAYYITSRSINNTPFTLFSIREANAASAITHTFVVGLSAVALLVLIFSLILSSSFSQIIISPIRKLEKKMASVSTNSFSVRAKVRGHDEIASLTVGFNQMMDRLDTAYREVYLTQISLKRAQLLALQSQMNPHFLYNTLDTIYWMSELGEMKNVSSMVSNLSSMMRFTISGSGLPDANAVLLREEIAHLKSYLYIIQMRSPDMFTFEMNDITEFEDCAVLKLLLQPIVENAVNHGLKGHTNGKIRLCIRQEDDMLVYEVGNNGEKIHPEEIYALLRDTDASSTRGFALRNINERLRLKYGDACHLDCYVEEDFSYFKIVQPLIRYHKEEDQS